MEVEPDAIVKALIPPSGEGDPPDVVALVGFVGRSPDGDARLYQDPGLMVYMDFRPDEVVFQQSIRTDEFAGRSVLWVNAASLREPLLTDMTERLQAEFLVGPIAARALVPETRGEAAERLTFVTAIGAWRPMTVIPTFSRKCCV